ncbi:two-component regulator propeller domain-containing protein [Fulvivirga ligni]|uniref:two-component regulator propeller domain-containing protein n=1 Tax=Fulvivirga ligni TaxID=2904246 RepID=UPI001F2BE36C|nr:two-component regulator propeller domain-containing protein [Fulvivirga ligni]UII19572.1 response regulator [Fulvivirga ligni]
MFYILKKLLFCLPFLVLTHHCLAQRARLFSTDSELSNSLIGDIEQDYSGSIWITTEEGINRYDGSKFTAYKEEDGILNNYVRLVYEDCHHQLYFGYFNGVQTFDHATDSFQNIPLILATQDTFPAHVLSMIERKDGSTLIGTSGHGIFKVIETSKGKVARQQIDFIPSYFVNHMFEDSEENLWLATQDKGLFCIQANGNTVSYFDPKHGIGNNINSVCEDHQGNIYAGSLSKGLFKLNKSTGRFDKIPDTGFPPPPIMVLHTLPNNQILIGTDGRGTKLYDPENNIISDLNFNVSNFDFSKSKVHTITEDNNGNFWLGLYQKGVAVIPARMNNFKYMGYQSVTKNIIGSNYIMSLYKDHNDILWVGTDSDGLYAVKDDAEQVAHYAYSKENTGSPSTVMCIFEDSNLDLWVGSYLGGLSKFNKTTQQFEKFDHLLDHQSNPIQRVYSITEGDDKTLWIGTLGFGLYSMNLNTGDIKNYNAIPNPIQPHDASNTLHNAWISSLLIAADKKLYFGTTDGVGCYDPDTKTFTSLNALYPSLSLQNVMTLFQNKQGELWVGSSHGLLKLGLENHSIVKYTADDGLPSNVIGGISDDLKGNLWISTNYGISKFNPSNESFVNYYFHDGLQGNEFSRRASFKDEKGQFYFGGINGITYFKPEEITDHVRDLDLAITGFYLNDTPVKKGLKSGRYQVIDTTVMAANHYNLAYDDNSFTVEFSAMEYINPKRITYLYAIDGGPWVRLQRGINTVTFNNLDPGTYHFQVKAKDFTTYSETRNLTVVIHPVWYFSPWAKLGYFLLGIIIVVAILHQTNQWYKTRKRMREHQLAEQINEAKLEFFTNISHEIRTPLSLILNPLRKLIANDGDNDRQRAYTIMRRNTERVLHLVNQLMDLRKIDHGKIALKFRKTNILKFVHETTEMFQEQILAKHIHFQILRKESLPKVYIDQNFFDKTIHNLLSNAIKFTPENGEITLSLETHEVITFNGTFEKQLKITCSDTGIGLKDQDLERIFDRFYQVSDNNSSVGNGIGLHLTRSIVDLHHGHIYALNNANGFGCSFVISLPLGKEHLQADEIIEPNTQKPRPSDQGVKITPPPVMSTNDDARVKSKTKKRVLVVDDNAEVRQYICNELASEYHMNDCNNGKEALSITLAEKPDLVISDIVMDEMDGITFCRKLKQNVNTNHIPVILLTAKSGEKDNIAGLGTGADAYISKPFNMEILKKTAENIIKNRELLKNNYSGQQAQKDKIKDLEVESPDEKLMQKIMEIINQNLDNPTLNVEMIANEIGISRVHLYRKLKEITNQSVRDLIRNIRLRQAAEILNTKNLNISEVAYATGFSNPSKFSTSFKEFYGVSPTVYLQNIQRGDR